MKTAAKITPATLVSKNARTSLVASNSNSDGVRLSGSPSTVTVNVLRFNTSDGAMVQLHLGENGQLLQQVAGTKADIPTGEQIRVMAA